MSVGSDIRCRCCGGRPDGLTRRCLEYQIALVLLDRRRRYEGAYFDATPQHWLTWHGHGLCGPTLHACPAHREDLMADVRARFAAIGVRRFDDAFVSDGPGAN